MKVKITLNGKTADIDIPDEKLEELGLKEKKKRTGYELVENREEYFAVSVVGNVFESLQVYDADNNQRYVCGNYYSNEMLAKANARADTLMRKLRRFAAENGGIPSAEDWNDGLIKKYYIDAYYNNDVSGSIRIESGNLYSTRDLFQIYFKSDEACKKAIEKFKGELIWYFTEYQAMLY